MRRPLNTFFLLLLVLLPACGDDRVTDITDPVDPATDAATLRGEVIAQSTQEPVVGATIRYGEASATSDDRGRFEIRDLEPGTATARASHTGFEDLELEITLPSQWVHRFALSRKELLEVGDFAMYVPAGVSEVRGILVALGGPDTRGFATGGAFGAPEEVEASLQTLGARFRNMAAFHDLAIVGTSLSALPNGVASDELILDALAAAAVESGRPDVATAPLLLYGMSGGAPQASGFAARHPERTIGLFLKVPSGIEAPVESAALSIPAFVALAADDAFVDNEAIEDQVAGIRAANGLWALATERAVPHHSLTHRHRELTLRWMRDVMDMRFSGPGGRLVTPGEYSGYLGDPVTGEIWEGWGYSGDPRSLHWLPTAETAGRWFDFGAAASPKAASFRLSRYAWSLRAEWTEYLTAQVRDTTGAEISHPSLTFSSDREDVARVVVDDWYGGVGSFAPILGVSEGEAVITVAYGSDTAESTVTVLPAVELQVDPVAATIAVGGTVDVSVRVVEKGSGAIVHDPEFAVQATPCAYCWAEEGPALNIVLGEPVEDETGLHFQVTGTAPGLATIGFYVSSHAWVSVEITVE